MLIFGLGNAYFWPTGSHARHRKFGCRWPHGVQPLVAFFLGWNFWKRLKSVVGWWMKLRLFLCNLLGPMFVSMSFPCHFFIWEEDPNSLHIWPVHYTSNYCWDGLKPSKSKSLSVRLLQDHMCLSQDIVYFSQEWIVIPLLIGLNIPVISSYKFMRNLIHDGGWPYCIRPL